MGQYTTGEEGRKGWTLGKSIHRAEFLRRKRGDWFPFPSFLPDPFPVVVDHLEVGHGKEAGGKQGEKISQQERELFLGTFQKVLNNLEQLEDTK